MSFYDSGNTSNTDQYIDTIDVLHTMMNKYSAECPVKMVGDFNTQLRRSEPCHATWN